MKRIKAIGSLAGMALVLGVVSLTGVASGTELGVIGVGVEVDQFEAEAYPVTVAGKNAPGTKPQWKLGEMTVQCDSVQYSSGMIAATPYLTVLPSYSGCRLQNGFFVTAQMNGCSYVLEMSIVNGGVTEDLVCPSGKTVELLFFLNESAQKSGSVSCKAAISRRSDQPVDFEHGWGTYTVSSSMSGLKYTYSRFGFTCPPGPGTFENGTYQDEVEMTGSL